MVCDAAPHRSEEAGVRVAWILHDARGVWACGVCGAGACGRQRLRSAMVAASGRSRLQPEGASQAVRVRRKGCGEMKMQSDAALMLGARFASYNCFHALFGSEPATQVVAPFAGDDLPSVLGAFAGQEEGAAEAFAAMRQKACEVLADGDKGPKQLVGLYNRLFVGPGTPEAAPWESAHLHAEGGLLRASTLEVRRAYVAQGLIPQSYPHVADDHIALELDFMRLLARRCADACESAGGADSNALAGSNAGEGPAFGTEGRASGGGEDALIGALRASRRFLGEHLLVWAPSFCRKLKDAAPDSLYAKAAIALLAFMQADCRFLFRMDGLLAGGEVCAVA